MHPVTRFENIRAIERVRGSASSLIHDQVITEQEFRMIMRRAFDAFGHPSTQEEEECHTQDHQNGEQ